MSLPMKAIDRLFERLSATYGRQWTSMWDVTPMNDVKSLWAHELGGFERHLEDIAWALENLPPRAPNVIEFRNLCRLAPRRDDTPLLPEPKANPARVAAEFSKLRETLATKDKPRTDGRDWARRILARHDAGDKVNGCALQFARQALHMELA